MDLKELKEEVAELCKGADCDVMVIGLPNDGTLTEKDVHELNYQVGELIESFIEKKRATATIEKDLEGLSDEQKRHLLRGLMDIIKDELEELD